MIDFMVGGFVNLLTYSLDSPRSSISNLLPKEENMSPISPFFNGIIILAFALMVFISQFASRIYISFRPNHQNLHGNSKELVSDSVLAIAIAFRLLTSTISLIWPSESFHVKVYLHCFGVNIILPLVILLSHQKARQYFGKMNPRIKNFFSRFNKSDPEDETQFSSNQASPASNVGEIHFTQKRFQARKRSNSFQSEYCDKTFSNKTIERSFSYPYLIKAQNISKVLTVSDSGESETPIQRQRPTKKSYSSVEMPTVEVD